MEYCINELDMTALQSSIPLDSSTFQLNNFFSATATAAATADDDVDFSSVDSFLDLSDHHLLLQEDQLKEEISNSQDKQGNLHFTTTTTTSFPGGGGDDSDEVEFPLLKQVEDFDDLEWLSRIVDDEDSNSKLTLLYNYPPIINHHHRSQPPFICFSSSIPAKPRTKRTRLVGKLWGSAAAAAGLSISSSSSSSSCSSTTTTTSYSSSNQKKKKRGSSEPEPGPESKTQKSPRCCSHCEIQTTPQWRSGPLGPKTLCNACGVRFKSGKLFPEYRPACSPTFTGELHSNSHRKVMEMRRKKGDF